MYLTTSSGQNIASMPAPYLTTSPRVTVLDNEDQSEVLAFLGVRPSHTFGMIGLIRDNGIVSPYNRGTFYACRDLGGRLEGVALIGHNTLLEARSESAIEGFASVARHSEQLFMVLGEQDKIARFWRYYSQGGRPARLYCRELLLEQRWCDQVQEPVNGLRLATQEDLDFIVPAHAQTVVDESGIDPLEADPAGFRERCARRILQQKSWVWTENGKLIFKAEVVTDTPEVIYLEGVWVHPNERGKGHGSRCMVQLTRTLLMRTFSVCLLVNEKFQTAQAFYRKAGYKLVDYYDTIFL